MLFRSACIQTGSKLVYISTTSVYGTQSSIVDENCTISELRPQSPYAESKLKSEQLLQNLGTKENLRYVTCRFGTIYGTSIGMRFHTAINKFCWQAVMGIPITVWKTAYEQKRPYLDLNDAIRAIIFIIENGIFNNELYNVLTNNLTVKEICEYIRMFVSNLQIEFVDSRIMNQLSYNVSSEKFSNLGFDSIGDIKAGIENTIKLLGNVNTFK